MTWGRSSHAKSLWRPVFAESPRDISEGYFWDDIPEFESSHPSQPEASPCAMCGTLENAGWLGVSLFKSEHQTTDRQGGHYPWMILALRVIGIVPLPLSDRPLSDS